MPSYEIIDGYVVFEDRYTHAIKRFHTSNTEIEECEDEIDGHI